MIIKVVTNVSSVLGTTYVALAGKKDRELKPQKATHYKHCPLKNDILPLAKQDLSVTSSQAIAICKISKTNMLIRSELHEDNITKPSMKKSAVAFGTDRVQRYIRNRFAPEEGGIMLVW
jgi:hypothetical protein